MEGKIIDTFRLLFIDIDQSYNIPVPDSASQGYMVVRAPKGNTEAMYFAKGSSNQIKSMIGIPTADWPDIQDAIDLNGQYGIYISAPAGTSEDYPSYYGGVYVTSRGLFPFHEVTNKSEPNFRALVAVESEIQSYLHNNSLENAVIAPIGRDQNTSGFDEIRITGVPAKLLAKAESIRFSFWGNTSSSTPAPAIYELVLQGEDIQVSNPDGTSMVTIGSVVNGNEIRIAGTNSLGVSSFMYLDFEQLLSSAAYKSGGDWADRDSYFIQLHYLLTTKLQWVVDIKDDTYMSISQKSQTEKTTAVTFTDIGYDQYAYDYALSAYLDETFNGTTTPYPTIGDVKNSKGLFVQFFSPEDTRVSGIYEVVNEDTPPKNVTADYRGRYIRIIGAGQTIAGPDSGIETFVDRLYFVDGKDKLILCKTPVTPEGTAAPRMASNFNTLTFSVTEDVYPGDNKSGGTFTGSLSETGRDSFGGNIYFKNILPDSALSFIEVEVYKSLDNINAAGFYDEYRIIDSRMYQAPSSVTTGRLGYPAIKGQRYVQSIVNGLLAAGTVGGAPVDAYTPVLLNGWAEAAKSTYEPVPVFVEPTGIESLKEVLYSLRDSSHKLATYVSPKLITPAEALDPASIIVSGRITGTAQLVNEVLRKDSHTGRKYWTSLTGAYGAQLLLIMEGKLGGWAPMYTNINGYGGQLPISVERAKYEFTPEQQQILDEKGLNPIILDPTYGAMVISQKTTTSPDNLSDWSYLGHSMAFDLFKREVRDNVMIPQIGKPNDQYYQAMRQRQVEAILNRRIGGPQPIWAAGRVEVANVNTDDVKAQRKFAIRVSVKVNVFSEWVELTFINVSQFTQL